MLFLGSKGWLCVAVRVSSHPGAGLGLRALEAKKSVLKELIVAGKRVRRTGTESAGGRCQRGP